MFIITKTAAIARPVSLEQIAKMVIVQRLNFITDLCWRRWLQRCLQSNNCCQNYSIFAKNKQNFNLHNNSSMDQRRRRRRWRDKRHQQQQQQHHISHSKFSQPFIVIAVIVVLALFEFVNCPGLVMAASKPAVRSIADNSNENDPNRIHTNWLEYQRQTLRPRATQSATTTLAGTTTSTANNLSPELGNIFTQLGIFIQARQRNATEMAQHIFFKYYNT